MAIVVVLILVMLFVIRLHINETEARAHWKLNSLAIIDEMKEKQSENGWSDEETYAYGEKLKDSLDITYPRTCPYCFVKSIFYK